MLKNCGIYEVASWLGQPKPDLGPAKETEILGVLAGSKPITWPEKFNEMISVWFIISE